MSIDLKNSLFHRLNRIYLRTVQKPVDVQSLKAQMQCTTPAQTGTTGGEFWIKSIKGLPDAAPLPTSSLSKICMHTVSPLPEAVQIGRAHV